MANAESGQAVVWLHLESFNRRESIKNRRVWTIKKGNFDFDEPNLKPYSCFDYVIMNSSQFFPTQYRLSHITFYLATQKNLFVFICKYVFSSCISNTFVLVRIDKAIKFKPDSSSANFIRGYQEYWWILTAINIVQSIIFR